MTRIRANIGIRVFSWYHQQVKLPHDLIFPQKLIKRSREVKIMLAASTDFGARFIQERKRKR